MRQPRCTSYRCETPVEKKGQMCLACKAERRRLAKLRRVDQAGRETENYQTPPHIVARIETYAERAAKGLPLFENQTRPVSNSQ